MNESFDQNQQNLENSNRKSVTNGKIRPQKKDKDLSYRHRLSDQKWRQNVSKGFAALKTIVKQNRKQSVEQLMAIQGTKEVPLNKKPSMANKRLSRIETLKATIGLIETKESIIENLINERQQQMIDIWGKNESPKSDKQSTAANGLQKIKDMFDIFEKRHEMESKEKSNKEKKVENIDKKKISIEDYSSLQRSKQKTANPILESIHCIKTEVFDQSVGSEFNIKSSIDLDKSEEVLTDWPLISSLVTKKNGFGSVPDINNNDINYLYFKDLREKPKHHSIDSFRNCSPLFESFSSLDNKSFDDYYYDLDPKDYLTTDLTEHLAITMPLMSFGPSLTYLNQTYL